MKTMDFSVSDEEIARRAYEIWQSRGCPPGDGSDHWQAAQEELVSGRIPRSDATSRGVWNWWCRVREKIARRDAER
jgi:hypothetical protein